MDENQFFNVLKKFQLFERDEMNAFLANYDEQLEHSHQLYGVLKKFNEKPRKTSIVAKEKESISSVSNESDLFNASNSENSQNTF